MWELISHKGYDGGQAAIVLSGVKPETNIKMHRKIKRE